MLDILDSIAEHWQLIALVILSAIVSGAAGGIGAHFINNERAAAYFSNEKSDHSGRMLYQFGSKRQSAFIGACGAIGFIFFLTAIDGINGFVEMKEILRFISLSMIAGFGARRLLPMMVGNLEKQIAHAEQSADKALITANANEKRMTRAEQKIDLVRINADLLTAAQLNAAKSRREHAMREAEAAISEVDETADHDQALPPIFVNLARLYRASGNLDDAIALLEKFVQKVDRGELLENANVSVAYYNLACYHELKHRIGTSAADLDRAMKDFEKSIELSEDPIDDLLCALNDADLTRLKEMKRFKTLLKRFDINQPADPAA